MLNRRASPRLATHYKSTRLCLRLYSNNVLGERGSHTNYFGVNTHDANYGPIHPPCHTICRNPIRRCRRSFTSSRLKAHTKLGRLFRALLELAPDVVQASCTLD